MLWVNRDGGEGFHRGQMEIKPSTRLFYESQILGAHIESAESTRLRARAFVPTNRTPPKWMHLGMEYSLS